jgi:hypothetical protein
MTLTNLGAENYDGTSTLPSATGTNAVAIGVGATAAGVRSTAISYSHAGGTDSFAANIGNSSSSRGAQASQALAIGYNAHVQASSGAAYGYNATIGSSGLRAIALGNSYANGTDSFAAAIANNTSSYGATGANSIAIGYQNKATSAYSTSIGSNNNVTAQGHAFGNNNTVSGTGLVIGRFSEVGSNGGMAIGSSAKSDTFFKVAIASGQFSAVGDAQTGVSVLRASTTNETTTKLTMGSDTRQVILPNNTAYFFSGTCVARESATNGTDMGAWEFKGCIRREGTAASTTLVTSTINEFSAPTGWSIALSADTTNGGLKVEVTGAAATNVRWVATVHTSEVTYA